MLKYTYYLICLYTTSATYGVESANPTVVTVINLVAYEVNVAPSLDCRVVFYTFVCLFVLFFGCHSVIGLIIDL